MGLNLQGKQKKDICREYGVAKSTMWGWVCKYAGLILKSWVVKGIEATEEAIQGKANRAKTELGKILGVDRTTIGFYEEGKRKPSINYLHRFCEHFRIWMDEFISNYTQ